MHTPSTDTLYLYIKAHFAAFRPLTTGSFRPTFPFIPHTAAYGLVLNIAAIETRLWEHDPDYNKPAATATLTRSGLPPLRIAVASLPCPASPSTPDLPATTTLYQHNHAYAVGSSGLPAELVKGRKDIIKPGRRECLVNFRAIIAIHDLSPSSDLLTRVRQGLAGHFNAEGSVGNFHGSHRYGLPFAGENHFLYDRIEEISPRPGHWWQIITPSHPYTPHTAPLTIHIDRASTTATQTRLFAPTSAASPIPPDAAWIPISILPDPPSAKTKPTSKPDSSAPATTKPPGSNRKKSSRSTSPRQPTPEPELPATLSSPSPALEQIFFNL